MLGPGVSSDAEGDAEGEAVAEGPAALDEALQERFLERTRRLACLLPLPTIIDRLVRLTLRVPSRSARSVELPAATLILALRIWTDWAEP